MAETTEKKDLVIEANAVASLGVVIKAVALWDNLPGTTELPCPWCKTEVGREHELDCAVLRARAFWFFHQDVWGKPPWLIAPDEAPHPPSPAAPSPR